MATVFQYRLFCVTENANVTCWRAEADGPPTVCPNNPAHEINVPSICIVDTVKSNDVNIASAASTAILMSQEKGFQDLTGHNFFKKGIHGNAAFGATTDFYLKFSTNMYLPGGGYRVGPTAACGDYIGVQIVDKDNILGYGAGLVLGTFIDTDYCWPEKSWEVLTGDAKMIPAGIYLRMRYVSTGTEDVDIIGWYSMRT